MTNAFSSWMLFLAQSDAWIVCAALVLFVMSVIVWTVICVKAFVFFRAYRQKREAYAAFSSSDSIESMRKKAPNNRWLQFAEASQGAFHMADGNRVLMQEQRKVQEDEFLKALTSGLIDDCGNGAFCGVVRNGCRDLPHDDGAFGRQCRAEHRPSRRSRRGDPGDDGGRYCRRNSGRHRVQLFRARHARRIFRCFGLVGAPALLEENRSKDGLGG